MDFSKANVFTIGGEISFQKRFIEKLNIRGFRFEWIGGKDWNVNSRNINVPSNTHILLCLKDLCPHEQRDPVRNYCKQGDIPFIEVEHTISKSYDTLFHHFPQYHTQVEYEPTLDYDDGLFILDFEPIA